MQLFKIEHYERAHGVGTFMPFRPLALAEVRSINERLKGRLGLSADTSDPETMRTLEQASQLVIGADAEAENFDLRAVMESVGLGTAGKVYLHWSIGDEMDELLTQDVTEKFDDIWYPSSNDLLLIEPDVRWVLMIRHFGAVSFWKAV